MFRRFVIVLSTLLFAFSVLFISVLRSASVRYSFSKVLTNNSDEDGHKGDELDQMNLDYDLAYAGVVLPDSILWPIKAVRDRFWMLVTTNKSGKAELNILFADKRLGASRILFENKKYDIGYSTLTKAEKYLETANNLEEELRQKGEDTNELAGRIAKASLVHRQVIEKILLIAPDDAKPKIIELEKYPKGFYESKVSFLRSKNLSYPENPFTD